MEPKKTGHDTKPPKKQEPNSLISSRAHSIRQNLPIFLRNLSRPRRQNAVETADQQSRTAKKDLGRQAPSLGLAEAHVVEGVAAAPPATRVLGAIGPRPEIGALGHLGALPP